MSFEIETTGKFDREIKRLVKKYPSLKIEFANLISQLKAVPHTGTPIGSDCYKIRISVASKGKGKSGGTRVITHVHISDTTVYLLTIYDKSERDTLSDKELRELLKLL